MGLWGRTDSLRITSSLRETIMAEKKLERPADDEELNRARMEIWKKVREAERGLENPLPDELTEDEESAILLMVLAESPGGKASEADIMAVLQDAAKKKFEWGVYRACMAGVMFTRPGPGGEMFIGLTERFKRDNPHLVSTAH